MGISSKFTKRISSIFFVIGSSCTPIYWLTNWNGVTSYCYTNTAWVSYPLGDITLEWFLETRRELTTLLWWLSIEADLFIIFGTRLLDSNDKICRLSSKVSSERLLGSWLLRAPMLGFVWSSWLRRWLGAWLGWYEVSWLLKLWGSWLVRKDSS